MCHHLFYDHTEGDLTAQNVAITGPEIRNFMDFTEFLRRFCAMKSFKFEIYGEHIRDSQNKCISQSLRKV